MTGSSGYSKRAALDGLPRHGKGRGPSGFRWLGVLTSVAAVWVCLSAGVGVEQAAALNGPGPKLFVTASGATNVGFQLFANVNLVGGTKPTGTVTFRLFDLGDLSCSSPLFSSTVVVSGPSVNSDRYWATIPGTYTWQVSYSGDAANSPSGPTACADPSAQVIVEKAYSNISLTAGQPVGGTIRASATVSGYNPTGAVTFYLTPPGDTFCSTNPIFTSTVTLSSAGSSTSAPFTPTVGGQYKWRATYSGDADNMAFPFTSCLDANAAVTVAAPAFATFTYPVDGQANVSTSLPFNWQPVSLAQGYRLVVGTTPGGSDLVSSGVLAPTRSSYPVPALPAGVLTAVIYTEVNGKWDKFQVISFNAIPTKAGFTAPTSGATNVDANGTFTWSTVSGVQGYVLWISTVYGGSNLVSTGLLPPTQSSLTPPPLPGGQKLYAILFTSRNGVWICHSITFTTATHVIPVPSEPKMTGPPAMPPPH